MSKPKAAACCSTSIRTSPPKRATTRCSGGRDNGYLVQKADGSPYLIRNSSFYAGMLDLSNPDARAWIKAIMKTKMIGTAGGYGWMSDFGEALPFDAKLHGGADPRSGITVTAWNGRK